MSEIADDEEEPSRITISMYDKRADDPLTRERGICLAKDCDVRKYFLDLRECDKRVLKKIRFTAENCSQETVELIMALDRCVHQKAFSNLR